MSSPTNYYVQESDVSAWDIAFQQGQRPQTFLAALRSAAITSAAPSTLGPALVPWGNVPSEWTVAVQSSNGAWVVYLS
jgi:hypothetical protein